MLSVTVPWEVHWNLRHLGVHGVWSKIFFANVEDASMYDRAHR